MSGPRARIAREEKKVIEMADLSPPDSKREAGKKRGDKSGKVADFRYKRPSRPKEKKKSQRQEKSRTRDYRWKSKPKEREQARAGKPSAPAIMPASQPKRGQAYAALDLGTNNCRLLIARPTG